MVVWDAKNNITQMLQLFEKVKVKVTKKEYCLKLRAILIRDKFDQKNVPILTLDLQFKLFIDEVNVMYIQVYIYILNCNHVYLCIYI